MSELQTLYAILVLIYLGECLVIVRRPGGCVRTNPLGFFRYKDSRALDSFGGILLSWPLPPLGRVALCQAWPISLSPDAVVGNSIAMLDGIRDVRASGRDLWIDGAAIARAVSPAIARRLAAVVLRVKNAARDRRARIISREIERSLDVEALRERLIFYRRASFIVTILSHVLFVYLFLVAPFVVSSYGLTFVWLPYVLGLLTLLIAQCASYTLAHRDLYADSSVAHAITIALAPPAAVRAGDALFRDLLAPFHPLAVASALCPAAEARSMVRSALREARYPAPQEAEPPRPKVLETQEWFRTRFKDELEAWVAERLGPVEDLLRPAPAASPEARGYCPRCLGQYAAGVESCSDCGGIPLEKYEARAVGAPDAS